MTEDQAIEQATLYVLDALTEEERRVFEQKLLTEEPLRELIDDLRNSTAILAYAAPRVAPPGNLRAQILSAARSTDRFAASLEIAPPRRSSRIWRGVPWAIAAGFAVLAGVLLTTNRKLEHQLVQATSPSVYEKIAELEAEKTLLEQKTAHLAEVETAKAELERQVADLQKRNELAEVTVATLTSKLDASYLASIVWDQENQEGILHVRRLPETSSDKTYQLWVIDPTQPVPISAGVFRVAPDGSASITFSPAQKVTAATTFAVSVEKEGGSTSPAGPEGEVVLSN